MAAPALSARGSIVYEVVVQHLRHATKVRLILVFAATHLALVVCGVSGIQFEKLGIVGEALEYYSNASGAGSGYGFFSPGVFGQFRLGYDRIDTQGITHHRLLDSYATSEADLRVGNIIDQFAVPGENRDRLRRSIAASFAANVFSHHPDTAAVVVRLEELNSVSMEEYRAGERSEWHSLYEAKFEHRKKRVAR